MVPPQVAREIEAAIKAALARRGVGGTVIVREDSAELHGPGPVVAIDLGDWAKQWQLLPSEMRDRRAEVAALRLAKARGDIRASLPPGRGGEGRFGQRTTLWPYVIGGAIAFVLCTVGVLWLRAAHFFGPAEETTESAEGRDETIDEERARTARVCEAARTRLRAGGSMAGLDIEGWEVVIWLARTKTPGPLGAELHEKLTQGGLADAAREALSVETGEVVLTRAPGVDSGLEDARRVTLRMDAEFVSTYLRPPGRRSFIDFAKKTAVASGADVAALYGKCAHLNMHDLGAWYWGRNDADAAAALLHTAGLYAEPLAVDASKVAKLGGPIEGLAAASAKLDADSLDAAVSKHGGGVRRIAAEPEAVEGGPPPVPGTAIKFPLGGPTRATQASRTLANQLGLAP